MVEKLTSWEKGIKNKKLVSVIIVIIATLLILGIYTYNQNKKYTQAMENSYNMAFYELVDYVGEHFASRGGTSTKYANAFSTSNSSALGEATAEVTNWHGYFYSGGAPFIDRGGNLNWSGRTGIFFINNLGYESGDYNTGKGGDYHGFRVMLAI